jgi:two-component system CheB/CheR fusion protein
MGPSRVVGIGGSAGALEPIRTLLAHLATPRLAIVVVVHLPRDPHDRLPEVLAQRSALPVCRAHEDQQVEAGRVHVVPAGWDLRLRYDRIWLRAASSPRRAIDRLFGSLAQEWGRSAVGVVMSGAGSDGAKGLGAIREAGGLTLVQNPECARFADLPRAALAHAQHALQPEAIAEILSALDA